VSCSWHHALERLGIVEKGKPNEFGVGTYEKTKKQKREKRDLQDANLSREQISDEETFAGGLGRN